MLPSLFGRNPPRPVLTVIHIHCLLGFAQYLFTLHDRPFHFNAASWLMPEIHYTRFPGKLPTCCGLVSDTINHLDMSLTTNKSKKSATSWKKVCGVVMEFGKRHGTTDTTDQLGSRQLVADLSRTCNGEADVMDFGLKCLRVTAAS